MRLKACWVTYTATFSIGPINLIRCEHTKLSSGLLIMVCANILTQFCNSTPPLSLRTATSPSVGAAGARTWVSTNFLLWCWCWACPSPPRAPPPCSHPAWWKTSSTRWDTRCTPCWDAHDTSTWLVSCKHPDCVTTLWNCPHSSHRNQMCDWFCGSPVHPHGVLCLWLQSHQPVCTSLPDWTGRWEWRCFRISIIRGWSLWVCVWFQPLPETMVDRLSESKKVCGAADIQLQVRPPSLHLVLILTRLRCPQQWIRLRSGWIPNPFWWAGVLRCSGSTLPRQTPKLLHHRHPEGDAAEILRIALRSQHGTSSGAQPDQLSRSLLV